MPKRKMRSRPKQSARNEAASTELVNQQELVSPAREPGDTCVHQFGWACSLGPPSDEVWLVGGGGDLVRITNLKTE